MKKRIMVALALAMIAASLVAGTAQAATRPLTLGHSAHPDPAKVGEPVHFVFTETNNQPFSLEDVGVRVELPNQNWFVAAYSSQGECTYIPETDEVQCDLGEIGSGDSAVIDVVVLPMAPGDFTAHAVDVGENQASESVRVNPGSYDGVDPGIYTGAYTG